MRDALACFPMADYDAALPIAGVIKELVKDGHRIKATNPPDWTGRSRKA